MFQVNYDAIVKNALLFKNTLNGKKLCAVVKCDAYSHGIERVASCLCDIVDMFAVGSVAEADVIEKFGKDILILLPLSLRDTRHALQKDYILTLDSFDTLSTILRVATRNKARVHIKIDSGMARLGFCKQQLPKLFKLLDGKNMQVEGVFSHFQGDSKNSCDEQLNYFQKCSKIVLRKFGNVTKHIANTSATLLDEKYHLDMARIGLGLYGFGDSRLVTAKTVVANVISIKNLCKGQTVSYGAHYVCERNTKIAILDIGYACGYPRILTGSSVLVQGRQCKIVGSVCMSMCMVDVTDVDVKVGEQVVVLGKDVNPANEFVSIYELLCNLK